MGDERVALALWDAGPCGDVRDAQERLEEVMSVSDHRPRREAEEPLRRAVGAVTDQAACKRLGGPSAPFPPKERRERHPRLPPRLQEQVLAVVAGNEHDRLLRQLERKQLGQPGVERRKGAIVHRTREGSAPKTARNLTRLV